MFASGLSMYNESLLERIRFDWLPCWTIEKTGPSAHRLRAVRRGRKDFMLSVIRTVGASLLVLFTCPLFAQEPLVVGERKQLFLDRRFIEAGEGIALHANPAQKLGALTGVDGKPMMGFVSRVIEDQGKIRLYLGHDGVEIFESDDALHFQPVGRSIGGGSFSTIFLDRHDPNPEQRYKLFLLKSSPTFDKSTDGVFAYKSADGLNFTECGRVLPLFTDNPTILLWDHRLDKYVVYLRALAYDSPNQRRIARIEVDNPLEPWPYRETKEPRPFVSTENVDVVLAADNEDDPNSDMYYNAATIYEEAQDAYLMFTSQFRHFSADKHKFLIPPVKGRWEDFGPLEVQLAVSRDGIHWSRPSREPYMTMGLPDEWDRWNNVMGPGIVRRGNYLYQYYTSSGRLHDGAIWRPEYESTAKQLGGVGVVRQRIDGFVSVDADHSGGWFRTPKIIFSGNCLKLNMDAGAMGKALVELQDAAGDPIPGFAATDCDELGGNVLDQVVTWNGSSDVGKLVEQDVRIKFKLVRTKLYSFQFNKR